LVLPEVGWEDINGRGAAYVSLGTGDLYRIPKEALIPGRAIFQSTSDLAHGPPAARPLI
jgi:hypothetical protein